jgi:hypothetical protein
MPVKRVSEIPEISLDQEVILGGLSPGMSVPPSIEEAGDSGYQALECAYEDE